MSWTSGGGQGQGQAGSGQLSERDRRRQRFDEIMSTAKACTSNEAGITDQIAIVIAQGGFCVDWLPDVVKELNAATTADGRLIRSQLIVARYNAGPPIDAAGLTGACSGVADYPGILPAFIPNKRGAVPVDMPAAYATAIGFALGAQWITPLEKDNLADALAKISGTRIAIIEANIGATAEDVAGVLSLPSLGPNGRQPNQAAQNMAMTWPTLVPSMRELTKIPLLMTEAQALDEMNSRLAYVSSHEGIGAFLHFGPNKIEAKTAQDLEHFFNNIKVRTFRPNKSIGSQTADIPAFDWWLEHPRRRTYARSGMWPHRPYAKDGTALIAPTP